MNEYEIIANPKYQRRGWYGGVGVNGGTVDHGSGWFAYGRTREAVVRKARRWIVKQEKLSARKQHREIVNGATHD